MANSRPTIPSNPIEIIQALDEVTEGLGNWVAGPTPSNGVAAAIQQRYRDACDSYSNGLQWTTALSPQGRSQLGNLCDPWLQSQGSGSPSVDVPFTGGQCDANYIISAEWVGGPSGGQRSDPFQLRGPISEIRFFPANDSTGGISVPHNPGVIAINSSGATAFDLRFGVQDITNISVSRTDGLPDNCGDPEGEPVPNPNPRPNPNLPEEEEPFDDPSGRPVVPMPGVPDPFGDPIQLPNFPLPPLFQSPGGAEPSNPNVGPPLTPGTPQPGNGNAGGDDDFGEPPQGHQWVGFIVKLSDQGVTEGLQPNSPPQPIYRAVTGNYRGKYNVDGTSTYSTPREIRQETSVYFLELAGLTLTGARVNVPPNDSYVVTPLSQPVTESEPSQV